MSKQPNELAKHVAKEALNNCRFTNHSEIQTLLYRDSPYWHTLLVGRHIGVHRPDDRHCNWTARILTSDKKYRQKCLGPALDVGKGAASFEDALNRAFEWFASSEARNEASEAKPAARTTTINVCPIGSEYSVGHALKDYTDWTRLSRSSGGHYNNLVLINHHIIPHLAHIPLEEFNATHLVGLAKQVLSTPPRSGFSPHRRQVNPEDLTGEEVRRRKKTFNSLLSILKMAFQHAWDSGKIESERPWRCIKRISVNHAPRTIFLTRNECRKLLSKCDPPLRDLILGALYTGCRVGELGRMRVEDVGRMGFGVRVDSFKRSKPRFVFLPDEGMVFFLSLCKGKQDRDLLFLSHRKKRWRRQHTNLFRRAVSLAGLPSECVFHGLRHTYASDLVRQGVPLEIVAKQLGHANSIVVSNTYGHLAEHYREEQIRTRFSQLSMKNAKASVEQREALQDLWSSFQPDDWREYAAIKATHSQPLQAYAKCHPDVAKAFLQIDR